MSKIRTCIFDLDGVIVDTAVYHHLSWNRLANELGFEIDESINEKLKGVSRVDSLNIILDFGGIQVSDEEKFKLAEKKNEWYLEFIQNMDGTEILPGVISFLDQLKETEIKIALGSSSKNARMVLDKIGLKDYFDTIVDGTDITLAKPDPEVFNLGCSRTNSLPSECVVFEDADMGIEAALNAGMFAVGVGKKENLPTAHITIDTFEDLTISLIQNEKDKANKRSQKPIL